MIRLYQFPRALGLPNASPFCMKLETWLRLTKLPYENVFFSDPRKAPKGKGPYIELDGRLLGDSTLIIEHLRKRFDVDPDAGLAPKEQAAAHAFERMLENHLYFALVHNRWIDERNWPTTRETFLISISPAARRVVGEIARRQIRRDLKGHGLGRHAASEIEELALRDIEALVRFLEDKPYLMGDGPVTVDCFAHGIVASLLARPFSGRLNDRVRAEDRLVAYHARMMERFYPELVHDTPSGA